MASRRRGQPSMSNSGDSDGDDELATSLSRFAREVEQQEDTASTLDEVVRAAIALIPGCDEASISVLHARNRVHSHAASGELPRAVDALQARFGEGPCLDSAHSGETIRVVDMSTEARWPRFSAEAFEAGAAGMLAFQLYVEKDNLGALNLFSRTPGTFDDESEHVGLMFAAHAGVAFAASRNEATTERRMISSQLIGQAQGILMERHKLTADQAFARLVCASQERNVKLRVVADGLVRSGQLGEAAQE